MHAVTQEAAPEAATSHVPNDVFDLDTIVAFLRLTEHPISRITAWRWAKAEGLTNYGTAREIRVSLSDFLVVHGNRYYPR